MKDDLALTTLLRATALASDTIRMKNVFLVSCKASFNVINVEFYHTTLTFVKPAAGDRPTA